MLLSEFVPHYAITRDLRQTTIDQLAFAARAFEKFAGPVQLGDLSADIVNNWIAARLAEGLARKTVSVQRMGVLCLWREAARRNQAPPLADHIRQVRLRQPIPIAWWPEEFTKLIATIDTLDGAFPCGVPRRLLLRAFALVGYYSGLRPGDLILLRSAEVLTKAVVSQSKTGDPIEVVLPDDAMTAVLATQAERRELLFPLSRHRVCYWLKRLRTLAGIKGSAKWLRRTGATRCEQQQPGSAMAFLGHRTHGLAYKHYVDLRQLATKKPIPPPP